jgi:hypothetical protein
MTGRIGASLRVIAGLTLLVLSVRALPGQGPVRWLAIAEIFAAAAFCLPRVWRAGAIALLGILGAAFGHHAIAGQFASSLIFAALVVGMALVHERA